MKISLGSIMHHWTWARQTEFWCWPVLLTDFRKIIEVCSLSPQVFEQGEPFIPLSLRGRGIERHNECLRRRCRSDGCYDGLISRDTFYRSAGHGQRMLVGSAYQYHDRGPPFECDPT